MSTREAAFTLFEQALNRYIRLDPGALTRLRPLHGRLIQMHVTGLEVDIFMAPGLDGIQVYPEYEGTPDCTLSGPPSGFVLLGMSEAGADELFSGHIQIRGDTELGQAFGEILGELDIDWEEQLSHIVGDIPAHRIGVEIRSAQRWARQVSDAFPADISEFLQEEARLLPCRTEAEDFYHAVDTVRDDVDRLQARVTRLIAKIGTGTDNSC